MAASHLEGHPIMVVVFLRPAHKARAPRRRFLASLRGTAAIVLTMSVLAITPEASHAASYPLFPTTFIPLDIPCFRGWTSACDLNGDGETDFVQFCRSTNLDYVVMTGFGVGDGTFRDTLRNLAPGSTYAPVGIADFDGDGSPDVIVSLPSDASVGVWRSNTDGTLQTPIYSSTGEPAYALSTGAVNGDGHVDVVLTTLGFNGSRLAALLGNGDGSFAAPILKGVSYTPYGIALTDFDGDGKLDALMPESGNGSYVHVLLGQGDGSFVDNLSPLGTATWPFGLAAADLNGDSRASPPPGIPPLAPGRRPRPCSCRRAAGPTHGSTTTWAARAAARSASPTSTAMGSSTSSCSTSPTSWACATESEVAHSGL